ARPMPLADTLLTSSLPGVVVFVLALARVGGLMIMAPILGSRIAPVRVRGAIAFFLAVAVLPAVPAAAAVALARDGGPTRVCAALVLEISIGFTVGLVAQFAFAGV